MESLNIPELGADFFAGNLHKWLFAPTAAAFLYVRSPELREKMHHPVISHNLSLESLGTNQTARDGSEGGLAAECRMLGTRDYSPMLAVPEAILFWKSMGGDAVGKRNHELVLWAAKFLAEAWGGEVGVPDEMVGSTAMVSLPKVNYG